MRLFKRGKYWQVEVERNVRRSLGTGDRREAERLFRAIQREAREGKLIQLDKKERLTLSDFIEVYLSQRIDVGELTVKKDRRSLSALMDSLGGSISLRAIRKSDINRFKSDCLSRGIKKTSINSYLRHIRAALNWARDEGYLQKPVKVPMLKVDKPLPRTLTAAERAVIREYAARRDPEIYRMLEFALWTGCRRAEIRAVRWQDVYDGHVRIFGKGSKERSIPLLPGAVAAMGERKDIGPVFEQIHVDTISHRFQAVAQACGLEGVHFHTLRHSAATAMVESGIRLEIIQKILGHADISTTKIYAQIYDQVVKDEMDKFMI